MASNLHVEPGEGLRLPPREWVEILGEKRIGTTSSIKNPFEIKTSQN